MSLTLQSPIAERTRLYALPGLLHDLEARIADNGGELTPEDEAELDALESTFEDKADALGAMIAQADADAASFEPELARLKARRDAAANRRESLKRYMHKTLIAMGRPAVKGSRFSFRIQRNGVPSIRWAGESESIPDGFRRVLVALDGQAAQQAHRAGTLPEGFMVEVGTHLRMT